MRRWQRPENGLLVRHSDLIGHIMEYGMKIDCDIGVMKTKEIAQSLRVLLDCVVGVVAIGRKSLCNQMSGH